MYDLRLFRLFCGDSSGMYRSLYSDDVKGDPSPTWLRNIGKTTKKKRWRKRQSRSCRFSFHKHFTIFFHLLLLFLYHFFFYTFFTHEIYPHPHPHPHSHPGPTPTTHDLYPLPTTFSYTRFSGAAYPIHEYRVSQKFVPLITRDIIFDRNYTSA